MTPAILEHPCFGAAATCRDATVAHEGLLRYKSKSGQWKERWFLLDASDCTLVKCITSSRQRSGSSSSTVGSRLSVATVSELSLQPSEVADTATTPLCGFDVISKTGQTFHFLTASAGDAATWIRAVRKASNGFADGVADRIVDRELLAGKYSLVRELGRGASAIVSLYTFQGKPYAVKKFIPQKAKAMPNRLLPPRAASAGDSPVKPTLPGSQAAVPEAVLREIALLKKASSLPNVIRLHDMIIDADHGNYYLVMEYMGGGPIAEWDPERKCYSSSKHAKNHQLPDERTTRAYMTNLLLGLQGLHQNNLCHRDIKPENLLANEDHTVCKIGDLGVAHYFREQAGKLVADDSVEAIENATKTTHAGSDEGDESSRPSKAKAMLRSTKGTYQFLPPEALSGDEFDGFKADVWAAGVTLYVLLFGCLPFFSSDVVELFELIENKPLMFPPDSVDEDAKDLLRKLLEKDPEKRLSIEDTLKHKWMQRNTDSKAVRRQLRALKRAPVLSVDDAELGGAVSVLQSRFDILSNAVQNDQLADVQQALSTRAIAVSLDGLAKYKPCPVETASTELPLWMQQDVEVLATQLHRDWCRVKTADGWVFGAERNDAARVHPSLVAPEALPAGEKEKNVRCVEGTLKCVIALGCRVVGRKESSTRRASTTTATATADANVDKTTDAASAIAPLPTDSMILSWEMLMLIDLLAENSHETWALGYIENGWQYGTSFDTVLKTHPSLRPYMSLEEDEKNVSREGVASVLKGCLCLGYDISCSRDGKRALA